MTAKRFKVEVSSDNYVHFTENGVNVISIGFKEYADAESCKYSLLPFCNRLNELAEENKKLKELIKLIANATSFREENSVKEILRNDIWGIDSVAGEYSSAWHDYVVLSNFFKEHYGEDWDNDKFD